MTAPASTSRLPFVAVTLAGVALVTVTVTVVVVLTRHGDASAPVARPEPVAAPALDDGSVPAKDVMALADLRLVERGNRLVVDDDSATALGLVRGDALMSINGKPVESRAALGSALFDLVRGDARFLYLETDRGGRPVFVRRRIVGGLPRPPAPVSVDLGPNPYADPDPDATLQKTLDAITRLDDTHYRIQRGGVDVALMNPMAVAKGARIVPAMKNGQPDGFKIYAVRPGGVIAALGLTNGDTIHSINGLDLTTPDKALEAYTKVRDATSIEIALTRRGLPVTLHYQIVD